MKESTLWDHLRPTLERRGKFQKVSDRFTPGVPDMLGKHNNGHSCAWEFKEIEGVRVLRVKFRPGQLDWLRDWERAGGQSLIVSTHRRVVFAHRWEMGEELETGMSPLRLRESAVLGWSKTPRSGWPECVDLLLGIPCRPAAGGKTVVGRGRARLP